MGIFVVRKPLESELKSTPNSENSFTNIIRRENVELFMYKHLRFEPYVSLENAFKLFFKFSFVIKRDIDFNMKG